MAVFQLTTVKVEQYGVDVHEVPAYSTLYGHHPRKFVIWAVCVGRTHFYRLGPSHDAFTGIDRARLQRRKDLVFKNRNAAIFLSLSFSFGNIFLPIEQNDHEDRTLNNSGRHLRSSLH